MIDNAPRTPLSTAFSINTSPSPFSVSPVSMPDLRNMRVHPLTSSPYSSQRAKDFRALLLEEPPRAYSTPISKRELRSSSSNGKPRKKNCYVYREQREDSDSELEETLSWRRGKLNWRNGDAVDEDDYEKGPGTDEEIVLGKKTPYPSAHYTPSLPCKSSRIPKLLSVHDLGKLTMGHKPEPCRSALQPYIEPRHTSARIEDPFVHLEALTSVEALEEMYLNSISTDHSINLLTPPNKKKLPREDQSCERLGVIVGDVDATRAIGLGESKRLLHDCSEVSPYAKRPRLGLNLVNCSPLSGRSDQDLCDTSVEPSFEHATAKRSSETGIPEDDQGIKIEESDLNTRRGEHLRVCKTQRSRSTQSTARTKKLSKKRRSVSARQADRKIGSGCAQRLFKQFKGGDLG